MGYKQTVKQNAGALFYFAVNKPCCILSKSLCVNGSDFINTT